MIRTALALSLLQIVPAPVAQGWADSSHVFVAAAAHPTAASQRDSLSSRLLRFWDVRGEPIAVVQYALIPRDKQSLARVPSDTVTFVLRQFGAQQEVRDTTWHYGVDRETDGPLDQSVAGVIIVPLAPWLASWSLIARRTLSGTEVGGNPVAQQPLEGWPIEVSDLALGVSRSPNLSLPGEYRALSALSGPFTRQDSVHVFYQVRSVTGHDDVRTWLTVTSVTNSKRGRRVMQLSFPGRLAAGVNVAERILVISKQKPGKYLLELQVGDLHGGGTSVRTAEFMVK